MTHFNVFKVQSGTSFTEVVKGAIIVSHRPEAPGASQGSPRRLPSPRILATAVLLALGCGATLRDGDQESPDPRLTECAESANCRVSLQRAEAAWSACWLGCSEEAADVAAARVRLKTALENEAQLAHERETAARLRLRQAESARELEHQADAARRAAREREREHQRRLELLAATAEQARAGAERERQERLTYLQALSPTQRLSRLKSCHAQGLMCDNLAALLAAAASGGRERRLLVDEHERFVAGESPAVGAAAPLAYRDVAWAAPNEGGLTTSPRVTYEAASRLAQRHGASAPAQCCDGTIAVACTCDENGDADCCGDNGGQCGCVGDARVH